MCERKAILEDALELLPLLRYRSLQITIIIVLFIICSRYEEKRCSVGKGFYWPWHIYGSLADAKDLKKILDEIDDAGNPADFQSYKLSGRAWDSNEFNDNNETLHDMSMQVPTLSCRCYGNSVDRAFSYWRDAIAADGSNVRDFRLEI